MIIFINCYEEMASGMRLLAAMATERGFDVHNIVLRGYSSKITSELDENNVSMHILVNGVFHVNPLRTRQFTERELELLRLKLDELNPKMICISTRSANDPIMPALLHDIKKNHPKVPIVCGGYGPTYAPEHYLRNGADFVLRGEGEISFMRLLDCLKKNDSFNQVPSLAWLENDGLRLNPLAPPLVDIRPLPSPLMGDQFVTFIGDKDGGTCIQERDPAFDNKTFCILVGRGCIGKCAYCAAPVQRAMYEEQGFIMPPYRRRGYDQVLQELERAKNAGIKKIFFKDEYFVDTTEALATFFQEYKSRIGLPFKANLHIGQLLRSRELLDAVIDADLDSLSIGFQSGTEEIARKKYGRPYSFTDLKEISEILYRQFVPLQFHFVSGTSLNTEDEFSAKCNLIASLPYDPLLPWRTALFDFQFFPQPFSRLTREIGEGQLKRLPVREWATFALRSQLFHFASRDEALETWEAATMHDDPVAFLLHRSEDLREKAWKNALANLTTALQGKQILVMGDGTKAFGKLWNEFSHKDIKKTGKISFPGFEATDGRIRTELLRQEFGDDIPLVVFDWASKKYMRKLKRDYKLANPVYGICDFRRRFTQ